jgi:hypothetical protein
MRAGAFLIFLFSLGAVGARAEKTEKFSASHPHRCSGWLSKDPPEILPFQEALEKSPLAVEMQKNEWQLQSPATIRRMILGKLELAQKTLNREPFRSQSPRMRAILMSWAWGPWIQSNYNLDVENLIWLFDQLHHFIGKNILEDAQYSSFDLARLRQAVRNFMEGLPPDVIPNLPNTLESDFEKVIEQRKITEVKVLIWSTNFGKIVNKKTGSLSDPDALPELAGKGTSALAESGYSLSEQCQRTALWIADFQQINSLYFQSMIRAYRAFTNYLSKLEIPETCEQTVNQAFSEIVEQWNTNDAALMAGHAALKAPFRAKPLAEQVLEKPL